MMFPSRRPAVLHTEELDDAGVGGTVVDDILAVIHVRGAADHLEER